VTALSCLGVLMLAVSRGPRAAEAPPWQKGFRGDGRVTNAMCETWRRPIARRIVDLVQT